MVSSVSFGTVNTIGGKTVLTGSQSGIDTDALVTALTAAKAQPATDAQTKITANQAKITAYSTLTTDLTALLTSVDALRNPTINSNATNAFGARSPFLTASSGSVSNYLGVTTDNGAPIGNYTLQVDQLATAETDQSTSFANRTSSIVNAAGTNTPNAFAAGTFQINGFNITLASGSSLNNVAAAINSQTANTNVTASIIEISPTDFRLQLTGKNTGSLAAIHITDNSHVLPYTTNPDTSTTQTMFSQTQVAQDAQIQFGTSASNLQTVTRPTNTISDLLDDTTISLYGQTNGASVSLAIDKDNAGIATSVGNFITAYNNLRTFQAQQNQRDSSGALLSTSVLANDTTLNTVMNQIGSLISGQASISIPTLFASGNTVTPIRMGDLGISLDNVDAGTDASGNPTPAVTNTLTLDTSKLNTNLESFFDQVANIFQFNFTASSSSIGIYQRDNTVTNSNFNVTVDTSQPPGSQATITSIDGSALTAPLALSYKTTTTDKSVAFSDPSGVSVVNASGSDQAGSFAAGTFQINGQDVTLTDNTSLTDVMNAINLVSQDSGVTASIVQNATSDYRLVLTGTAEGTSGITITDHNGVLPSTPMFTATSLTPIISGLPGTDLSSFNFAYTGTGNDTVQHSSGITSKDITLSVDTSQPAGSQALVTKIFGATLATPIAMQYTVTGSSVTINGMQGTPFSGLQMIYTGNGLDTVDISMSQGIADQLYNAVNGMVNGTPIPNSPTNAKIPGIVAAAVSSLTDTDTKLTASIATINDQVSTYRDQLLTKFAAMEAAISASNQLLQLLSAQDNAALVNSGH